MTVALESLSKPHSGKLDVDVRLSCEVNYTAVAAKRRVSGYVASNVSVLMGGRTPLWCWLIALSGECPLC